MAWLSRVNFISSDTLSFTDVNNLGNDIRAWGDNVNGGGYTLSNVVLSASAGTMATVIGGTGTTSTLTLRSTSGVGTTGADIIFQTGNNGATEVMRLQNGGNVGIGTATPVSPARLDLTKSISSANLTTMRQLRIGVDANSDYSGYIGYGDNSAGFYGLVLQGLHANVATASFIALNPSGGNVGIGTSSPDRQLMIYGTGQNVAAITDAGSQSASLLVASSNGTNGAGGTIQFGGVVANGVRMHCAIKSVITNTASNGIADLTFSTRGAIGDTNLTERMRIDSSGNVKIGGTADRATTAGTAHLDIFNGTAPAGTLTNGISIYSSSGEAYVMDAAGNATLFSPHDSETNEWIFDSTHTPSGKRLKINVERLLRFINDHFGLDCVHDLMEEA